MSLVVWDAMGVGSDPISRPVPLSLPPNAFLSWAGFTDESSPVAMDSEGVVRVLIGSKWRSVLRTRTNVSCAL